MRRVFISLLLISLLASLNSAPSSELVTNLYGDLYSGPVYSGYLDTLDSNRKLHYMFVPSQSNASIDPVVLWLNGGPGCSSLLGIFMENGPVVLDDYDAQWRINQYSWNKFANMLYIESPAGVGFSYTKNNATDLNSNDEKSANDNEKAVLNFFSKFPEFKNNEFYISGESYAGVYVPWLAKTIIQNNDKINLKGIIVGNGLTDVLMDVEEALIEFAYSHMLYSQETYDKYNLICKAEDKIKGKLSDFNPRNVTKACNKVRQDIQDALQGLNIYDVYRQCPPREDEDDFSYTEPQVPIWPDGCKEDKNLEIFLNNPATKNLLHVDPLINWMQCNDTINENYHVTNASFDIYKNVLINTDLKIWFYSGDTDAAVPFTGSVQWIPKLGLEITEEYRIWNVNNQTVGYVQSYGKRFKYVTVKGTGHMAPQWKRNEAFIMFNAYLKGESLPYY